MLTAKMEIDKEINKNNWREIHEEIMKENRNIKYIKSKFGTSKWYYRKAIRKYDIVHNIPVTRKEKNRNNKK